MAKEYAKAFYKSKEWIRCRDNYKRMKCYICERCGETKDIMIVHHKIYITPQNINNPDITLNYDYLELLCQDCHNKEHHKDKTERRYEVDEQGRVII